MDFIKDGVAHGNAAQLLLNHGSDPGFFRPYVGRDGGHYISQNVGGVVKPVRLMVGNTAALLQKDEWIQLDTAVLAAAKERLTLVKDIMGAGLTYNIPNGMGKTVLQTQTMSDITGATISMDPARKSEGDRPQFDLGSLPLPVVHKDFYFNARDIAVSRNSGMPVDVTTAQLAARKVSEEIEKLTLGVSDNNNYTYGGGTIYGLTNFPQRVTRTLTLPTGGSWTPQDLLGQILLMKQDLKNVFHFGPYRVYTSPNWDVYLDDDYSENKGDNTLRERILKIDGIQSVNTLDYLTGYQIIMIQFTSDVIRMVNGMTITTLQWETNGGMTINFKVMAIMVPQLRSDYNSHSGIAHGTAA